MAVLTVIITGNDRNIPCETKMNAELEEKDFLRNTVTGQVYF